MKKLVILFLFFCSYSYSFAIEDTLRYWDKQSSQYSFFNSLTVEGEQVPIHWQFARFLPEAPCYIKSITLVLYGQPGEADVYLLGHEAGSTQPHMFVGSGLILAGGRFDFPVDTDDQKVTPVQITFDPPIYTANNQFYVAYSNVIEGQKLLYTQNELEPYCESSSGGTYYYQLMYNTELPVWGTSIYSYCVEAVVDYPMINSPNYFRDVTAALDLPEDMSNQTIAFADYDKDNFLDLMVAGRLFKNNGGLGFTEKTEELGMEGLAQGNIFADTDNDGDMDMICLRSSADGEDSQIYVNDGSSFKKHKLYNVPQFKSINGFCMADINKDSILDLYVCQLWSEYPEGGEPNLLENYFFYGDKLSRYDQDDDIFHTSVAQRSRACQFADYDDDGNLDLFVANYYLENDELWTYVDGEYKNRTGLKNIDQNMTGHNHGTGCDWYDYDNDGDLDLLVPQLAHPFFRPQYDHRGTTLYDNSGAPYYDFSARMDATSKLPNFGMEYEETHAGAAWGDVNNDGLADFIITTYYGCRYIDLYVQNADHTFSNKTFEYGLEGTVTGEDACWADFDNDGRLDLAIGEEGKFRLYRNNYISDNNFVEIDLECTSGNINAIGARVKVTTENHDEYLQEVGCGRGQKMQKPTRLHFGLGTNETAIVDVKWPNQSEYERFYLTQINTIVKLTEGTGGEKPAPQKVVLTSPANNSKDIEFNPVLKWEAQPLVVYEIQVSESQDFSSFVLNENNLSQASRQLESLGSGVDYFWHVRAVDNENSENTGEWSDTWKFTTLKGPDTPVLTAPANGEENVKLYGNFTWEPVSGADKYYLQVSDRDDFATLTIDDNNITTTEYKLETLSEFNTYFWRVAAINDIGQSAWSTVWQFTTGAVINFDPPDLTAPANNAKDVEPGSYLEWTSNGESAYYHLQVSDKIGMSNLVIEEKNLQENKYELQGLEAGEKYYWRVAAGDEDQKGNWSSMRSFTTKGTESVEKLSGLPDKLMLGENQPNPFSGTTSFDISIPEPGYVKVKIIDINGKVLETLVSEFMEAGIWQVSWNAESFQSGIYYYVLETKYGTMTKKMVLSK